MFKHEVTYEDYNGVERKETIYFNLSKAELIKMEIGTVKGTSLSSMLQKIVDSNDNTAIVEWFTKIIEKAYGRKSDDGTKFEKSKEIYEAFEQSPAYDEFFVWLLSDTNNSTAFVKGIIPANYQSALASATA
jgi:hypothetical protein